MNDKSSHNKRKKGINIIIPLFLLLCGMLIIVIAGWKLISQTYSVSNFFFEEPNNEITEKKFLINNQFMERPKLGSVMGKVIIPSINLNYPLIHGDDNDNLEKGIGHFPGSTLPGENGNVIIDAHRDTHFRNLGKLKIGDIITIETNYGIFDYRASKIRIVDGNDKTVIVASDKEMLTVYTCYPFNYVGSAPQRYVVLADFVGSREEN